MLYFVAVYLVALILILVLNMRILSYIVSSDLFEFQTTWRAKYRCRTGISYSPAHQHSKNGETIALQATLNTSTQYRLLEVYSPICTRLSKIMVRISNTAVVYLVGSALTVALSSYFFYFKTYHVVDDNRLLNCRHAFIGASVAWMLSNIKMLLDTKSPLKRVFASTVIMAAKLYISWWLIDVLKASAYEPEFYLLFIPCMQALGDFAFDGYIVLASMSKTMVRISNTAVIYLIGSALTVALSSYFFYFKTYPVVDDNRLLNCRHAFIGASVAWMLSNIKMLLDTKSPLKRVFASTVIMAAKIYISWWLIDVLKASAYEPELYLLFVPCMQALGDFAFDGYIVLASMS
ncbi:hypothetical protein Ddc_10351 [Ditylenchus destructor]|nr:hypothetical protein Ddc_10351 [Ditylenchus destructor]